MDYAQYQYRHDQARDRAVQCFQHYMGLMFDKLGLARDGGQQSEWRGIIEDVIEAASYRSVALVRAELGKVEDRLHRAPPLVGKPVDVSWIDLELGGEGEGLHSPCWPDWVPGVFGALQTRVQNGVFRFVHGPLVGFGTPHAPHLRTFRRLLETPHKKFLREKNVGHTTLRAVVRAFRTTGIEWKPEGEFSVLGQQDSDHDVSP
jgi:hypothetical protein